MVLRVVGNELKEEEKGPQEPGGVRIKAGRRKDTRLILA